MIYLRVSLAVDPRRWCSCHADGTDTRPAVLRKPLSRHPRAGTNTWLRIRLSTIGGISALAARGGRTCAHQTWIRSTATSFFYVNPVCKHGLVIKFSEYTTIRTRPVSVKHCANGETRLRRILIYRHVYLNLFRERIEPRGK